MENSCDGNSAVILVVDDDPGTRDVIVSLLAGKGYQPVGCGSAREALSLVDTRPIDLIVLDVLLPDGNGLEVARTLREKTVQDSYLPILLISALDGDRNKCDGLEYADDYVTKPFSHTELVARIGGLLRTRMMHRELVLSRRLYQYLYDNILHMFVCLDEKSVITDCNAAFCRITGREKGGILGNSLFTFFSPQDEPALKRFLDGTGRAPASGGNEVFNLSLTHGKDTCALVSLDIVYVGDICGPGMFILIAMQDITQKVRFEESRKIARKQLYRSARLASIGTLASGVAHEINNPLTAILGFSGSLLERTRKNQEIPRGEIIEYLDIINSEALRCRDIIENLTNFARDRDTWIRDISLWKSVEDALNLIAPRAKKKNIGIENLVDGNLTIKADSARLGQVIVNIVNNSIDFCDDGAVVTLTAAVSDVRPDFLRVSIRDDGPGIPQSVLPKVFDPFFTTKEVGKGTGLGLATSYAIMEEFNGSIDILSEEGAGTTVVLEIPLATLPE